MRCAARCPPTHSLTPVYPPAERLPRAPQYVIRERDGTCQPDSPARYTVLRPREGRVRQDRAGTARRHSCRRHEGRGERRGAWRRRTERGGRPGRRLARGLLCTGKADGTLPSAGWCSIERPARACKGSLGPLRTRSSAREPRGERVATSGAADCCWVRFVTAAARKLNLSATQSRRRRALLWPCVAKMAGNHGPEQVHAQKNVRCRSALGRLVAFPINVSRGLAGGTEGRGPEASPARALGAVFRVRVA